jgi:hypothetical protein
LESRYRYIQLFEFFPEGGSPFRRFCRRGSHVGNGEKNWHHDCRSLLAGGRTLGSPCRNSSDERAALIALYIDTDGDFWLDNAGWKTPPLAADGFAIPGTECNWDAVYCDDGETTVWVLDLGGNLLFGSIPAELEDLVNLQYLFSPPTCCRAAFLRSWGISATSFSFT